MKRYVDIHCHILPGMDDGARDLTVVREMLSLAYANGIETIIATPHFGKGFGYVTSEQIAEKVQQVQQIAESISPSMKVFPGEELMFQFQLLEQMERREIVSMAGSRYVLVEFAPGQDYVAIRTAVQELVTMGYWPIVAHIERYPCFYGKIHLVRQLIDMGAYIQVNSSGFKKGWLRRDLYFAKRLFNEKLIDFIGTDGHDSTTRKPVFQDFIEYARHNSMETEVNRLLIRNPEKIICDMPIRTEEQRYT